MNKKQEKMVSDYIENNQNFIKRIQKEIGRYESVDVTPFYERMKNQEEKAETIEFNIRAQWRQFRKNHRDLPFETLAKKKDEFNHENEENFNRIEEERKLSNSYKIAHDGMLGIKNTLLGNIESMLKDYIFEFLKENIKSFRYSLTSESYRDVFSELVHPIEMFGNPLDMSFSHWGYGNKNVYDYHILATSKNNKFNILNNTGHLDIDNLEINSVQVIPYDLIVQRAIDLEKDERRIQDAKDTFEKMISNMETKYKSFEFHPDYYRIDSKNY